MKIGWLDELTAWILQKLQEALSALWVMVKDAVLYLIEAGMDLGATIFEMIPVPDWLSDVSLCTILSAAGPTVGWIMNTFQIGEGLAIIGSAWVFRLLRKLFTLGQW